ncbi:MAG: hypothetical protein AAFY56_08640 [Pseudomonadota bacterium]
MQNTMLKTALLGTAVLAIAGIAPASAQTSFEGETVEIIVPFSQGGAVDVSARFLEPFFEKHLPGQPSVEVVNRPGGAGLLGANWFAQNAETNGTQLMFTTSSTSHPYILGQEGVEYDLSQMPVAFALPFGPVFYASPSTNVETPADLFETDSTLIYGGISAAGSDLPALLAFEVLQLEPTTILGFPGRGPVRLAFERGETNFDVQYTPVYLTQVTQLVEGGKAVPLMTGGSLDEDGNVTQRDAVVPDLPSVYEVYETLHGEAPSGIEWDAFQTSATLTFAITAFLPGGTPDEVQKTYDEAIAAINADPEFQAASKEVTGGHSLTAGSTADAPLKAALKPDPVVLDYIKGLLSDKYNVRM